MAKADLTAQRLRELLHYDPQTGVFTRLVRLGKTGLVGSVAGSIQRGRMEVSVDGVIHAGHRLAWLYMTGSWPSEQIDHKDGDPSNNVFENLRDVNQFGNMQNVRKPRRNNQSGYLGVRKKRNKWVAAIHTNGVAKQIGTFDTPELASAAYLEAKRLLHPTCTI